MTEVEKFAASGGRTVGIARPGDTAAGEVIVALENAGFAVNTVSAEHMHTVGGVFEEFSAALEFPDYFGNNKDAFDECMRELDETVGEASGYAIVIRHASELLADEPDELEWFVDAFQFYEEHYGDSEVEFRVLLVVAPGESDDVQEQWRDFGAEPVELG
ncbi:barstar family protein [Tomitella cavernea]|uniref:Barstar (barnase inhibitor) domain-containing protein n=1 Tax=Tomitella cavernea TaxID=1387982 RepID=A0ABP9CCN0_9ACTN|nr:barstar family protein [Tomitella cavernea]